MDDEETGAAPQAVPATAPTLLQRWLPLGMICFASLLLSFQALTVSMLTSSRAVPPFQIVVIRGLCQLIFCAAVLAWAGRPVGEWLGTSREEVALLCGRGFTGFGGISFAFLSLAQLPLAEAQVLGQTTPIFASVYAWVLLREPWHKSEFASALFGVVGVAFIARPAALFGAEAGAGGLPAGVASRWPGIACSLMSAMCAAAAFVFVRMLGTRVKAHWAVVMMYQALGQVFLGLPCMALAGETPVWLGPRELQLALACGVAGFLSQTALTYGMQRERSAMASLLLKGFGPMNSIALQAAFLPSQPLLWTTVAGFCVVTSGMALAVLGKLLREAAPAPAPAGYVRL